MSSKLPSILKSLKTGVNGHIDQSFEKVQLELDKYKEAYDLISNSSIVLKLKKKIRKLTRMNEKLTQLVVQLSTSKSDNPDNTPVGQAAAIVEEPTEVVFIKTEKIERPNIVYELVEEVEVEEE
jgi:hypothetical protein